jgi:SAM-dependent methyltransferase
MRWTGVTDTPVALIQASSVGEAVNPFDVVWVAERYAAGRPNVHPAILKPLRSLLEAEQVSCALDLGCGTGLSSVALARYAARVVGIDVSRQMLRAAIRHGAVTYVTSRAETLPFRPASFALASMGCAFHWCDPASLFVELDRVLRPGALLLIYDNAFLGEMQECKSAQEWFASVYQAQYPAPARGVPFWPDPAPPTFEAQRSEFVDEWIAFTLEELIRYLTTQSNISDAVGSGRVTLASVEDFLHQALAHFYRSAGVSQAHFRFGGFVHCLRHRGSVEGGA